MQIFYWFLSLFLMLHPVLISAQESNDGATIHWYAAGGSAILVPTGDVIQFDPGINWKVISERKNYLLTTCEVGVYGEKGLKLAALFSLYTNGYSEHWDTVGWNERPLIYRKDRMMQYMGPGILVAKTFFPGKRISPQIGGEMHFLFPESQRTRAYFTNNTDRLIHDPFVLIAMQIPAAVSLGLQFKISRKFSCIASYVAGQNLKNPGYVVGTDFFGGGRFSIIYYN